MLLKLAVTGKLIESVELNPVVRAEDYILALCRERTCAQTVGFYLFESVGQIDLFLRVLSARALCVEAVERAHQSFAVKPKCAGVDFSYSRLFGVRVALFDYLFNRTVRRADYPAVAGRIVYLRRDNGDAVALFLVQGECIVYCFCVDERSVAI